jgi:predicted 2-oxoglutarate/Fe(II)-dependent dioxygenase YbiX
MLNQEIILTSDECQSIIDMNQGFSRGGYSISSSNKLYSSHNTSYQSRIETSEAINQLLLPKLSKYDIKSLPPQFNLLKYEVGHQFKKHKDISERNKHRVKTLIIQLSDGYKGGELIIWDKEERICDKEKGNMILFPAKWLHEARPVLEGIRYSMVYFLRGENFGEVHKSII